jgi:hypothetical protein
VEGCREDALGAGLGRILERRLLCTDSFSFDALSCMRPGAGKEETGAGEGFAADFR